MKRAFNPILPLDEYIPDGEPHVFGDRIYLFGSHDTEGGDRYCAEGNYVGWSAPLDNPADWRFEGEIYSSRQDPLYKEGETNDLYAPDVVRGNDGRYYLYYGFTSSGAGTSGHDQVSVAVCDTPAGRYEYLGFVHNPDGSVHKTYLMGDPAVINDDGVIRLYCGWSLSMVAAGAHAQGSGYGGEEKTEHEKMRRAAGVDTQSSGHQEPTGAQQASGQLQMPAPGSPAMNRMLTPVYKMLFHRSEEDVKDLKYPLMGANTIELEDDMMTVKGEPKRIVAGQFDTPQDSGFFGHAFYEASSIRKINGIYYFIYSSENSNELCYATSRYPDRDFTYGGTIISNGDVGYKGLKKEDRNNMTANDHGSLECINGQWYIFHHRQTHKSTFSRQACVEKVTIKEDGSIDQVECTSMGFSNGPLKAEGEFPAPVSCVLTNGHMPHCTNTKIDADIPYITHGDGERFITDIKDGTKIGYKYIAFEGKTKVTIKTRGTGEGVFEIHTAEKKVGEILIAPAQEWTKTGTELEIHGVEPLYFVYHGSGAVEFLAFELE